MDAILALFPGRVGGEKVLSLLPLSLGTRLMQSESAQVSKRWEQNPGHMILNGELALLWRVLLATSSVVSTQIQTWNSSTKNMKDLNTI